MVSSNLAQDFQVNSIAVNPIETELFVILESGNNSQVIMMSVVAATGATIFTYNFSNGSRWVKPRTAFYFDNTRVYFELQKLDPDIYVTPTYYNPQ